MSKFEQRDNSCHLRPSIERLNELFLLDHVTGVLFRRETTSSRAKKGSIAGCINKANGYGYVGVDGRKIGMHRVVFAIANGYMPAEIDHIDGNPANNRPSNLREATHAENCRNRKLRSDSSSSVKGVDWHKKTSRWRVRCQVDGKQTNLGYFKELADAEALARAFRVQAHGNFCRHE